MGGTRRETPPLTTERVMTVALIQAMGAGVVLLAAVYGCVQGVRWLVLRVLTPTDGESGVWLVPLCGHREDVEYLVRTAAARRCWGVGGDGEVYVVNMGADEETCALAACICRQVHGTRFLDAADLPAAFSDWVAQRKL